MILFFERAVAVYSALLHIAGRERFALTFPPFTLPRLQKSCLFEALLLRASHLKSFFLMLFVPLFL